MLRNPHRFVAALLFALLAQASPTSAQPNIVFIMADDLGWTDTSNPLTTLGNPSDFYQTPTLDLLATQGMSFTNAYANQTCAPTRSAILSGAYAPRSTNGIYEVQTLNPSDNTPLLGIDQLNNLPDATLTHAETLQLAGYTTGYVGKFHITSSVNDIINQHGFDVNYGGGTSGGPGSYFASGGTFGNSISASLDAFAGNYTQAYVDANIKPYATDLAAQEAAIDALVGTDKHLTDASADAAIAFMEASLGDPFFLQYSPHAVHTPIASDQARSDLLAKYEGLPAGADHDNAPYAAILEGMDQSIARLVDYLQTTDDPDNPGQTLDQNTLLIFYSDNGGAGATSNSPLNDTKGSLDEGGLRVPMIAWSANSALVEGGTVSDEVVVPVDFYTTFASLAGATLPTTQTLDGVDLSGVFADASADTGRDSVFWHFPGNSRGGQNEGPQSVIRQRIGETDWKLTYTYEDRSWELYNLDADIDESDNLATTNSDLASQIGYDLLTWLVEVDAPLATVRSDSIQVDVVGSALAYANGSISVYTNELLTFNAGEEMPLFLSVLLGDADLDGDVDTSDITSAIIGFTGAGGTDGSWSTGDFDGDGDVDTSDITSAIINFTGASAANEITLAQLRSVGAEAYAADLGIVPEPNSLALLGLGGLMLVRRKRC